MNRPKFKYGEKVVLSDGFFDKVEGSIVGYSLESIPYLLFFRKEIILYEVEVVINGDVGLVRTIDKYLTSKKNLKVIK